MAQRETLARVDDLSRRNRVASAREVIYEKNYAVDSKAMEDLTRTIRPIAPRLLRGGAPARCRFYPRIFTYSADYREKYVSSSNTCILRLKYTVDTITAIEFKNLSHFPHISTISSYFKDRP
jgi:hypothetical protein